MIQELHEGYGFEQNWPAQYGLGFDGDVAIVADDQPNQAAEGSEVDTSFVLAAEDRSAEEVPAVAQSSGGDKKPPTDLPGEQIAFEDPEENNEGQPIETTGVVGIVATSSETTMVIDEELPTTGNIEIVTYDDGSSTLINRAHTRPDLLDRVVSRLEDDKPWAELEISISSRQRRFFADEPEEPSFFLKVTDHSDNPEGQKELEVAPLVQSIVASGQAQDIVRNHGFSSITYVEPLAVVDKPGEHEIIAYPYQQGNRITDKSEGDPTRLNELHQAVSELSGLFAANDVDAFDLTATQIIADGNNLYLLDAEHYRQLEPLEPTLEAGEVQRSIYGGWERAAEPGMVEPGKTVLARQAEDGTGVQLSATTQDTYIVALWNTRTAESGLLNVRENREAYRQVEHVAEHAPSLTGRNVIAHIIGPTNMTIRDPHQYPLWSDIETAVSLSGGIAQVSSLDRRGQTRVSLDTGNGRLEVTAESGETWYFNPPTRIY